MARMILKADLTAAGITLTQIAKASGVSVGFVSRVVSGTKRSLKVEREIARALERSHEAVFPTPPQRARRQTVEPAS